MIPEIKTVCFVGAGTMGCYNALISALAGYDVVIYDRDEGSLSQVRERQQAIAAQLITQLGIPASLVADAFDRVITEIDLPKALSHADLISESIFEVLDIKREVLGQLDKLSKPDALLTSNTSNLLVSEIEKDVENGARFAALHSYLGAPLIDIVGGTNTSAKTIDILTRYVESLSCMPLVLKKEYPGYVLNALLGPVLGSALSMQVNGIADKDQIDKAWMHHMKAPMGPFGMMDFFGLNLILDSWLHKKVGSEQQLLKEKVITLLKPYVEAGQLGIKTGKGFYQYPSPTYEAEDFCADAESLVGIFNVMAAAVITSACKIAISDVAAVDDIEQCWQVGTRLAKGPFTLLKEMGVEQSKEMLIQVESMASMHGRDDFNEIIRFIDASFA